MLQRVLIADDVVIRGLELEDYIAKEVFSYVVMNFEQVRDSLLGHQNDHSTDDERCCVVIVNDEQQVLFHIAY